VALTDEQNAMLRLLAQGEQGYADIAALMGLSEDEVRAKVVGALAQLQAEGKPAPDVPPPIAGGAQPAAEVAPPEPEPVPDEPEEAVASEEAEPVMADAVAPSEDAKPVAPAKPAKPKAAKKAAPKPKPVAKPAASPPPSGGKTVTLPTGRKAWIYGGGAVVAVAVIVAVILLVSGGSSDNSSSTASSETPPTATEEAKAEEGKAEEETTSGAKPATEAKLEAVDGSEAKGVASFGRVKNKLALQIEATGLEGTEEGVNSYAIWLAQSPKKMIPLASTAVKGSGKAAGVIAAQFEVPVEILGYLASGTFDQIAVTKVENKPFEASIAAATKRKQTPTYLGEEVLYGTITGPIVGLAAREEEEKKAEEEGK
jgi:hypothetical protein